MMNRQTLRAFYPYLRFGSYVLLILAFLVGAQAGKALDRPPP